MLPLSLLQLLLPMLLLAACGQVGAQKHANLHRMLVELEYISYSWMINCC